MDRLVQALAPRTTPPPRASWWRRVRDRFARATVGEISDAMRAVFGDGADIVASLRAAAEQVASEAADASAPTTG